MASVFFPPGTPGEMTEYAHVDGATYVRIGSTDEFASSFVPYSKEPPNFAFADTDRRLRRSVDNYAYNGEGLFPTRLLDARKANQPLFPDDLSETGLVSWYEKAVEDQIARFEERCERLIVSAGTMWAEVAEPVLALDFVNRNGDLATSVRPIMRPLRGIGKGSSKIHPPHAVFRLDELDRLYAFCRASGVAEAQIAPWTAGRVVVHDAIRLSLESERASIYCVASRLAKRVYGAAWLPDLPLVDDLYRLVNNSTENDCPDEMGDVLSELVELHRAGTRIFDTDFEAAATDHVVQLWDSREIALPPESPPSTKP